MRDDRRDDADQIDVVASHEPAPIGFDVLDIELARDSLRMLTMPAGNGDDLRAGAVLKTGNLRRPRKARANDSYSDCFCDFSTSAVPVVCPGLCLLLTAF